MTEPAEKVSKYISLLDDLKFVQTHTDGSIGKVGEILGSLRRSSNSLSSTLHFVVKEVGGTDSADNSLREELDRTQAIARQVSLSIKQQFAEQHALTGQAGKLVGQISEGATRTNQVVKSTQILAMNTKIEGYRLGAAGRAVMVLADSVESINREVQGVNNLVAGLSSQLGSILPQIDQSSSAVSQQVADSLSRIENSISALMQQHTALLDKIKDTTNDSARYATGIQGALSDAITELQFSDRVSQVVERVKCKVIDLLEEIEPETAANLRQTLGAQSLSAALTHDDPDGLDSGEINFL